MALISNVENYLVVEDGGNVGIGTTDPSERLHIQVSTGNARIKFKSSVNSGSHGLFWEDENSASQTQFYYDHSGNKQTLALNGNGMQIYSKQVSASIMEIAGSGGAGSYYNVAFPNSSTNVGIGTNNPGYKLHVYDSNAGDGSVSGGILIQNAGNATGEAALAIQTQDTGSNKWFLGLNQDNHLAFSYGTSFGDPVCKVNILPGGGVGIGTTDIKAAANGLHVKTGSAGAITTNGAHDDVIIEGSGNTGINIFSPNTSYQYLAFGDPEGSNSGYVRYYHSDNQMILRSGGSDTFYVNNGSVGVGSGTHRLQLELGSGTANRGISWGGTSGNYANIWTEYSSGDLMIGTGVRPTGTSTGWVSSYGGGSMGRTLIQMGAFGQDGDITFHTEGSSTIADGSAVTLAQRMIITSGGNVGINSDNPSNKFVVRNGTNLNVAINTTTVDAATVSRISSYNDAVSASVPLVVNGHPLVFTANGTESMRLVTGGNVGIGITNPAGILHLSSGTSGDAALIIEADTDNNNEGDGPYIEFRQDGSIQESAIGHINYGLGMTAMDNALVLANSVSAGGILLRTGSTNGWTNANNYVYMDTSGKLGIGTTGPSENLHIYSSSSDVLLQSTGAGTASRYMLKTDDQEWRIGSHDGLGDSLWFYDATNSIYRVVFTNGDTGGSRVGIGSTSPVAPLNIVHGTVGAEPYSGIVVKNTDTSGTYYTGVTADAVGQTHYRYMLSGALKWQTRVGAGNGTDDFRLYSWTKAADVMVVKNNGAIGIGKADPKGSTGGYGMDINGSLIVRAPLNAHDTSAGVFERNGDKISLRAYGATAGTGYLSFQTGGGGGSSDTQRMIIEAGGNVGIGTGNAHGILHTHQDNTRFIMGATNSNLSAQHRIEFWEGNASTTASNANFAIEYDGTTSYGGDGALLFRGSASAPISTANYVFAGISRSGESFFINNVGIGTTNPSHKLHVYGSDARTINITRAAVSNAASLLEYNSYYTMSILNRDSGSYLRFGGNGSRSEIQATDGATTPASKAINLNPYGGFVGIGTTRSETRLDVYGTISIRENNNHALRLEQRNDYVNDANHGTIWISDGAAGGAFAGEGAHMVIEGRRSARNLYFKLGDVASPYHVMTHDNKVGIGTVSPTGKLDVYVAANRMVRAYTSTADLDVLSDNNSAPVVNIKGTGSANLLRIQDGSETVLTVEDGGRLHLNQDAGVTNATIGAYTGLVVESDESHVQIIAADTGSWAGSLILSNAPGSGTNRHWWLHHNPSTGSPAKNLSFNYAESSSADGFGGDATHTTALDLESDGDIRTYHNQYVETNATDHANTQWYSINNSHNYVQLTDYSEVYIKKQVSNAGYGFFALNPKEHGKNLDISFRASGGSPSSTYRHVGFGFGNDSSNTIANYQYLVLRYNPGNNSLNQVRIDSGGSTGNSVEGNSIPNFWDGTERHYLIKIRDTYLELWVDHSKIYTASSFTRTRNAGRTGWTIYEAAASDTWLRIRDYNVKTIAEDGGLMVYNSAGSVVKAI